MIHHPGARPGAAPGKAAVWRNSASWMFAAMLILMAGLARSAAAPVANVTLAPTAASALDAGALIELIDRCSERAVPEIDIGFERLAQRCPDLMQGLQRSDAARWLPRDWMRPANDLTVAGLAQLRGLLRAELDRSALRAAPSLGGLDAAIARFAPKSATTGWWARFRAWLRRALDAQDTPMAPSSLPAWLHVPPWLLARLAVGGAVLIILVTLGLLVRHLHTSGVLTRRTGRARGVDPQPQPERAFTLADLDRAPLLEQPSLLLRFAAPRLSAGGAALTARELRERAAPDGAALAPLIELAETIRYAPRPPADERVRMTLAAALPAVASLGA